MDANVDHHHHLHHTTPSIYNVIVSSSSTTVVHRQRLARLAGEDAGAGDLVVGDRGPVDGDLDTGVGALWFEKMLG